MTTDTPEELAEFADLRRVAVGYAQQASGGIWTDFNLHDPGVTLLEQSCFALSELAYQVAHPDRDLLTDARGHFNFQDLALFTPRKVLNTAPVTTADLEAWLSECPDVARVSLHPAGDPGLFDLLVIPASDDTPHVRVRTTVAAAFDAVRPLCCDRGGIRIARCRRVRLAGQVEMMPGNLPEFVAAQLYHAVSIILRGGAHDHGARGATRKDVYDTPEALLHDPGAGEGGSLDLDDHLGDLRALPALRDIGPLQLVPVEAGPATPDAEAGDRVYQALHLPQSQDEIGLVLTLNGVPVTLDPERLGEEYGRIAAERIALSHHHIDRADWQVMQPGRPRDFARAPVDDLLPMIYRAAAIRSEGDPATLTGYRGAIDGHLVGMARDLADLPRFFTADADLQTLDPGLWRQKLALLDYLIALQGEEMPATRHTGLHLYLGARARHRFELDWRLGYLRALPRLNATRATAPNAGSPGGFLGRLCLLADLTPGDGTGDTVLARHGLMLDESADPATGPADALRLDEPPRLPPEPLDMLGIEEDVAPLSPEALGQLLPWLAKGTITARQFLRLAQPHSLALAPQETGWALLFEDDPALAPLQLARFGDRIAAQHALSQLRATARTLHREGDTAVLIEDIRLRQAGAFRPHRASLVLAGWTARGALGAFRSYVSELVEQHAPAHLLIRPLWLSHGQSTRFAALKAVADTGDPEACTALREFLDTAGAAP